MGCNTFGISNAPTAFMDLMNRKFKPHLHSFLIMLIDYIFVYSKSLEEHEESLRITLQILREMKLYAKLSKCKFWLDKVMFLSHVISKDGIFVDPKKIMAMVNWSRPTKVHEIHNFLGLIGYYRRFVEDFSIIARPLTKLTQKNIKFEWEACKNIFQ